jgi:DNA-binding GntR family transcriptional regulator
MLEKVAINIARMSEPFKRLSLARPFRPNETCNEWQAIIQAVELMDPQQAYKSMYQHIQNSMDKLSDPEFESNQMDRTPEMEVKS